MEDILDLYEEPCDPHRPLVCFDEMPYQLTAEVRQPRPMQAGRPQRYDYEYKRMGTRNLFMFFHPLGGWRHVKVTQRRTKRDYAHCMRDLVDIHFPDADVIRVVQDNLNTHTPAALYETFEPAEARRILRKLEFHYTPVHRASGWLNMVEIEFSVLVRQCLDRRIPNSKTLQREVSAWQAERNARKVTVDWQFTSNDARVKLTRLYAS